VIRLGIQTIPASTLLVGEASLSCLLHYGVILPSPIGIELMEFPAKMILILEGRKITDLPLKALLRIRYFIYTIKR
jgi:hypothetical protein